MAAWGGSQAVAETAAYLAPKYGAWISSRKRAASHPLSRSNPGSDHNTANTTAYALDYATFNGAPLAHAIARHFGISNYSTGNYNFYYIRRGGATFRLQILWAVSGHFNHVHLGVRLVSGTYTEKPPWRPKAKFPIVTPKNRAGNHGPTVKRIQRLLRAAGRDVKVDGDFGPKTARAVRRFKKNNGLPRTARVGHKTWRKLRVKAGKVKPRRKRS